MKPYINPLASRTKIIIGTCPRERFFPQHFRIIVGSNLKTVAII